MHDYFKINVNDITKLLYLIKAIHVLTILYTLCLRYKITKTHSCCINKSNKYEKENNIAFVRFDM